MSDSDFTARHYAARARDYVTSAVHSVGADLDQIEATLQGHSTAHVLDLGCGGGHCSYRAAPLVADVVACDVTQAMLDEVADTAASRGLDNIRTQHAAAEALPFADASFDIVLSRFTTHHWQDRHAGLRETRRVLKPGGFAILIDAIAPSDPAADTQMQALELLRDPSHVRNYSLAEWTAMLGAAGFVLHGMTLRTLRMVFSVWTARTRTPAPLADAIRTLQAGAAPGVRARLAIGEDGSFDLDAATMVVRPG